MHSRQSALPFFFFISAALLFSMASFTIANDEKTAASSEKSTPAESDTTASPTPKEGQEIATFGAGCFWCTEAVMERMEGVIETTSGYMGGHVENPTYDQVCQKETGHIEVVQVIYDPSKINYEELLDAFWQMHDPTSWDQQGDDRGPQYRSAIFTHNATQKRQAEASKRALEESKKLSGPVVTEIRDADTFWIAEERHQNFYTNNPNFGYCRVVISPKLKQFGFE